MVDARVTFFAGRWHIARAGEVAGLLPLYGASALPANLGAHRHRTRGPGQPAIRVQILTPAASGKALKRIRQTVRHWRLHRRSDKTLSDLARMFNAEIRGWIAYYSRYHRSA